MWPFSIFRQRVERRRHAAALALFVAAATFERLDAATQARVDAEINRFPFWSMAPFPAAALQRWAPWDVLAAERAIALARLRIEPILEGTSWQALLAPWALQRQRMIADFRPLHPATSDARAYLAERGIVVADRVARSGTRDTGRQADDAT